MTMHKKQSNNKRNILKLYMLIRKDHQLLSLINGKRWQPNIAKVYYESAPKKKQQNIYYQQLPQDRVDTNQNNDISNVDLVSETIPTLKPNVNATNESDITTLAPLYEKEDDEYTPQSLRYAFLTQALWHVPLYYSLFYTFYQVFLLIKYLIRRWVQLPNNTVARSLSIFEDMWKYIGLADDYFSYIKGFFIYLQQFFDNNNSK